MKRLFVFSNKLYSWEQELKVQPQTRVGNPFTIPWLTNGHAGATGMSGGEGSCCSEQSVPRDMEKALPFDA